MRWNLLPMVHGPSWLRQWRIQVAQVVHISDYFADPRLTSGYFCHWRPHNVTTYAKRDVFTYILASERSDSDAHHCVSYVYPWVHNNSLGFLNRRSHLTTVKWAYQYEFNRKRGFLADQGRCRLESIHRKERSQTCELSTLSNGSPAQLESRIFIHSFIKAKISIPNKPGAPYISTVSAPGAGAGRALIINLFSSSISSSI